MKPKQSQKLAKLKWLTIAVSSCMLLTACGSGNVFEEGNGQVKTPPTPKNKIEMVTKPQVKTLSKEEVNSITDMQVKDDKLVMTLPKNSTVLPSLNNEQVVYLPPSDDLPFGYSGVVEKKNADGSVVMREATLTEVFDELDIDFNSSRATNATQVGVISVNPNVKMSVEPQGHQVGALNKDYESNYRNCAAINALSHLETLNQAFMNNSTGGKKLELKIPFPSEQKTSLNVSMDTGCQPIKNNRFATKNDKVGSKFIINFNLPFKDKNKNEATLAFNLNLEDLIIKQKIKYKDKKWHDFTKVLSGNVSYEFSLTGKVKQKSIYEMAGANVHEVWDSLKLGAGNKNGKIYGELYGLDGKDKKGLLPLGGIIIIPGLKVAPQAGNVSLTDANKAFSIVVWVYLRADGTLSLEGKIATGMEKIQFQKGITSTVNENGELVPTISNEVDDPVAYNSLDGTLKADVTMGATVAADMLIAGIRPATVQIDPITYKETYTLKGNAKHIWYSNNPDKPKGVNGSLCLSSEKSLYSNLFMAFKLGATVKFFGWEQKADLSYSKNYKHDWLKNNKQEKCIMGGQTLKATFTPTPVNIPKVVSFDIDYQESLNETQKNILIDNWKVKVYNHNTKLYTYIDLPKNSNGKATLKLPYGHNYDVALVAMGNPFGEKQEREIAKSNVTNFNLGTDPTKVIITSVDVSPKQPIVGKKYRITINGEMLIANLNLSGCIAQKLVDFDQHQAVYECTAPNLGQSLLMNISSFDGKYQYHKFGIEIQENNPKSTPTKLTATGITQCANDSQNRLACTLAALGAKWHGLGQDGEIQAGQKMSYTTLNQNGAECVRDNVTGLIWEQKTDDGTLRDKDNTYTWYSTDSSNNGGHAGKQNGGQCVGSACDTQDYITKLNASNYCGYNDWRLPTFSELDSIVDYGRVNPSINPIFKHTQSSDYWSSSPFANYTTNAWLVDFNKGSSFYYYKVDSYHVRAVRENR